MSERNKQNIDKVMEMGVSFPNLDETKVKMLMALTQINLSQKVYHINDEPGCENLRPKLFKDGWNLNYPRTVKLELLNTYEGKVHSNIFSVILAPISYIKGVHDEEVKFARETFTTLSSMFNYLDTMKEIPHENELIILRDRKEKWEEYGFIEYEFEMIAQIIAWFSNVLSKTVVELLNDLENIFTGEKY